MPMELSQRRVEELDELRLNLLGRAKVLNFRIQEGASSYPWYTDEDRREDELRWSRICSLSDRLDARLIVPRMEAHLEDLSSQQAAEVSEFLKTNPFVDSRPTFTDEAIDFLFSPNEE